MNYEFLPTTALFAGTTPQEAAAMLGCLGAREKTYQKGETIYRMGETVHALGLVLAGSVLVESSDLWGNNSILGSVPAGQVFAETYAFLPQQPLLVNVTAREACTVLFLDAAKVFTTCPTACAHHSRLITNLTQIFARKNLNLALRMMHTAPKTIRGRLLSYFSQQATLCGSRTFTIPFNRQQLADYLGVERSALSGELSKMRRDGLLAYRKNVFTLYGGV